jgi:hypothetical protein
VPLAKRLAVGDEEGVVLVEHCWIGRKRFQEESAPVLVAVIGRTEADAAHNAPRVGVDNEGRQAGGVEDDGVGGLGTDSGRGYEPFANGVERLAEEHAEAAAVVLVEHGDEGFDLCRLGVEIAGRADDLGQPGLVD